MTIVCATIVGCNSLIGLDKDYYLSGEGGATSGTVGNGGTDGGGGSGADSSTNVGGNGTAGHGPGTGGAGGGCPWTLRQPVTIDLGFDGTVQDFPVAVFVESADFDYASALPGGADLRFTDDAGMRLSHEIELWEDGGLSLVWVTVPTIVQAGSSHRIWMHYGNPDATDGQSEQVWASFHAVWHLAEPGDSLADASGNHAAATNVGATRVMGKLGYARSFDATGANRIVTGTSQNLAQYTVEGWGRASAAPTALGQSGLIMRERNYQLAWNHDDPPFRGATSFRSGTWESASFGALVGGTWVYLVAVYDGATLTSYKNGQQVDSVAHGTPDADVNDAVIGRHAYKTTEGDHFDGLIDEVRISPIARSSSWIQAQHRSMNRDGLATLGATESGCYAP